MTAKITATSIVSFGSVLTDNKRRATSHLPSIVVPDVRPDDKWSKGGHAVWRERARAKLRAVTEATREYRREMARSRAAASERANFWPAMAARTDWRLAGAFGYSGYYGYGRNGAIMLRINGDQIETSAGARIPLAAAPMVWERVQRALGVGYKPAGLGVKIGDYPLTEIRPDGTLVAGCHVIPHSELRAMARALNLGG